MTTRPTREQIEAADLFLRMNKQRLDTRAHRAWNRALTLLLATIIGVAGGMALVEFLTPCDVAGHWCFTLAAFVPIERARAWRRRLQLHYLCVRRLQVSIAICAYSTRRGAVRLSGPDAHRLVSLMLLESAYAEMARAIEAEGEERAP